MILYLDSSALVKRYISEENSDQVNGWIASSEMVVTAIITRVEVAAAISRIQRMNFITLEESDVALRIFRSEWEYLQRLAINENTMVRADYLACELNLRGYDATHLASALIWQETTGYAITMASFDEQLLQAASKLSMEVLPRSELSK